VLDPLDLLAWVGGGVALLVVATPFIRRRESERMRRTLEDALGTGSRGSAGRAQDGAAPPGTAAAGQ